MKTSLFILFIALMNTSYAETCYSPTEKKIKEGFPLAEGPKKGHCIATDIASPVSLVFQDKENDTWILKNVMEHGKHGFLVFHPEHDLQQTIFERERFTPKWIAAHTQIRLHFTENSLHWYETLEEAQAAASIGDEDPAELPAGEAEQAMAKEKSSSEVTFSDLILSIEAIGEEGYTYGLLEGQENYFALVYRAVSLQDKIKHMITDSHDTVDQWDLDFSQKHYPNTNKNLTISFIEHFMTRSEKDGLKIMYNTLAVNCTNELFRTMQEAFPARPFNQADLNGGNYINKLIRVMEEAFPARQFNPTTFMSELIRMAKELLPARPFNKADIAAVSLPILAPDVLKDKHMISRSAADQTELNDEILQKDFKL